MLLALDLATTTGWCAGDGSVLPQLGTVRMPDTKEEVGPFLDYFFRWMHAKVTELQQEFEIETTPGVYGPRSVDRKALICVIEAPLLPKARIDTTPGANGRLIQAPTSIATTRKLQGLAGFAETVCFQRNVLIEEVHLQSVKKALGGSGRADKPDMMAAAERCGLKPKVHDEADAFGVWICAMRAYARQYQHLWDQRLYGPRTPARGLL